jgi:TetR/AcrR family transcriptional regulator, regulator of cefoperazone and chloramphenicol sensitivity
VRTAIEPLPERGEATRQRLIEAALEVFGECGFNGASTRMLADKAGANLAAIPYHFHSKEGLYRAAAQHIVDRMKKFTAPTLDEIEQSLRNPQLSRAEALHLLHRYTDMMAAILVGSKEVDSHCAFVMREHLQPGAAFDILYTGMMRRVLDACAGLLAVVFHSQSDAIINLRASAIFGQILIFRTSRNLMLRRLGWKDFSEDRLVMIQSIIWEHVERIVAAKA